ncbi:MAG TPA: septum formation initiator family protein [Nevskiaceae bacterium]|nr:septum formation initiator family protein [Nevskiaceae bacterium]
MTITVPRLQLTRHGVLTLALLVLLGLLQYRLWWGDGGVVSLHAAQARLAHATARTDGMKKRNDTLSAYVSELAKGGSAIEARARTQLGMIHKGETFYLVVKPAR